MKNLVLVKHASGAPGLRIFGLGAGFVPKSGVKKLKILFDTNTSWAKNRSIKDIKIMLSNSDVVVSAWMNNSIIGFGRATTDCAFRTTLWDIVVDKQHQTFGLGKRIINLILKDSKIMSSEKTYLMTTNCENFYRNRGFKIETSQRLMIFQK